MKTERENTKYLKEKGIDGISVLEKLYCKY